MGGDNFADRPITRELRERCVKLVQRKEEFLRSPVINLQQEVQLVNRLEVRELDKDRVRVNQVDSGDLQSFVTDNSRMAGSEFLRPVGRPVTVVPNLGELIRMEVELLGIDRPCKGN